MFKNSTVVTKNRLMCNSLSLPLIEKCEAINHLDEATTLEQVRAMASSKLGELQNFDYTAIANGLSQQLIYQMNIIRPGILTSCEDLNVQLENAAYALLQPPAKAALKAAIQERGIPMKINSGYRTIAQQQILYNGRFVRDLPVAEPGASNHQSGLALDIQDPQGWRPYLERYGWDWLGTYDPPHFDFYGSDCDYELGHLAVLAFQQLWNKDNPDQTIQADGIYGPGTERCINQTYVRGFDRSPWEDRPRILKLATPRMEGADVAALQEKLVNNGFSEIEPDGIFGPNTDKFVKAFQVQVNLKGDGIVGSKTLAKLQNPEVLVEEPTNEESVNTEEVERGETDIPTPIEPEPPSPSSWLQLKTPPIESLAVRRLQAALFLSKLDIEVNGIFDLTTSEAVKSFQKRCQLADDGIVGPQTIIQLQRIVPSLSLVDDTIIVQRSKVDSANPPASGFFDRALDFTLRWEGGKVDNPVDIGGRTNFGVTQKTFDAYRSKQGLDKQDVFDITLEQVREIYFNAYWLSCQGENMVLPLAVAHFDTAVLFGVKGAMQFLQESLGLSSDGVFGDRTKVALAENNNQTTAAEIVKGRIAYHKKRVEEMPNQATFLQGWLNRAEDLRTVVTAALA